ncbi:MAG: hypothetical protein PWQ12_1757 [Clostridiales bacterium]|jgi:uncharacterized membrane protein YraQ (UPF0718 family)|nr:hypothetical protein [Clostridiales bacterium]
MKTEPLSGHFNWQRFLKKNKLLAGTLTLYLILFLFLPSKAESALHNSLYYLAEMAEIMPVVFFLTTIIEVFVPQKVIVKHLGESSGLRGNLLALLLGSFSAGPIYAAFPVCKMLRSKGAGISNITIILSAWAVVKVPMLITEAKFLGPTFMITRWILTVIAILIMGRLTERLLKNHPERSLT